MSELPEAWAMIRLGDCLQVIRGASPRPKGDPRYFGGPIPWISIKDINAEPGKYLTKTREGVTEAGAARSRLLEVGSLILSNSGSVCLPKILKVRGCIHDGFLAFPNLEEWFDTHYAFYMFDWMRPSVIAKHNQGMTQVNLNTDIVRNFVVPLAPRLEQRRIAKKLDEVFGKVDQCRTRLDRVSQILKKFREAVLEAAVSGRLTEEWRGTTAKGDIAQGVNIAVASVQETPERFTIPETWRWCPLGMLTSNHDNRRIPVRASDRAKRRGKYPYYGAFGVIDSIDDYRYDGTFLLIAEDGKNLESRDRPIAVTANGQFWVNNHAHVLQAKPGIDLQYLNYYLNSRALDLQPYLTGIDQIKLTRSAMDKLPVPVPPELEGREVVRRISTLFAFADSLESRSRDAVNQVEKLPPSVLAKAFRGELVPQDPDDEPAGDMLARVTGKASITGSFPPTVAIRRQRA